VGRNRLVAGAEGPGAGNVEHDARPCSAFLELQLCWSACATSSWIVSADRNVPSNVPSVPRAASEHGLTLALRCLAASTCPGDRPIQQFELHVLPAVRTALLDRDASGHVCGQRCEAPCATGCGHDSVCHIRRRQVISRGPGLGEDRSCNATNARPSASGEGVAQGCDVPLRCITGRPTH